MSQATRSRPLRILAAAFAAVMLALAAWVALKSMQLRPGGDDYCLAVGAQFGIVGGPAYWWGHFSGFLTPTIAANTLVGMTLLHLPLPLASSIPFLVTALVVAAAVLSALPARTRGDGASIGRWTRYGGLVIAAVVAMVAWWTYWWLPMSLGVTGDDQSLAQSVTHNQNPNVSHVMQAALTVIALFLGWRIGRTRRTAGAVLAGIAGVIAGFSGPAMAAGLVLTMVVLLVARWAGAGQLRDRSVLLLAVPIPLALVALLISLAAPGTRVRAAELDTTRQVGVTSIGETLNALFPRSIVQWAHGYLTWGAVAVILLAVAAAWLAAAWGYRVPLGPGLLAATMLSILSLILALTATLGQVYSYNAFWHFLDNRVAAFAALCCLGAVVGSWLADRSGDRATLTMLTVALVAVGLAIGAILTLTISIAARHMQWESGPAPIAGVVTELLDDARGPTCWGALTHLRDLPTRGVTRELPAWDPAVRPLMGAN